MRFSSLLCVVLLVASSLGFLFPARPSTAKWNRRLSTLPIRLPRSSRLFMGMRLTIRIQGRKSGGEAWLDEACSMYQKRLRPAGLDVETEWHKTDSALVRGVLGDREKGTPVVLLDPKGKSHTSEQFASDLYKWLEEGGSRLVCVIGGAEGLPSELKEMPGGKFISLSKLTFTHQFARLILMEQIYRASEIRKGSGYHK